MSSEGTGVTVISDYVVSSQLPRAYPPVKPVNQLLPTPAGAGRNIELVDAHGNIVQIPVENLQFVNKDAPSTATARTDPVNSTKKVRRGPPGVDYELRDCFRSMMRCECTPDQLLMPFRKYLTNIILFLLLTAVMGPLFMAWKMHDIAHQLNYSYTKCGWTYFRFGDGRHDVNVYSFGDLCYDRDIDYKHPWCVTRTSAPAALVLTAFSALLTLIGAVRIKWRQCCCKCPALIWFGSAAVSMIISIIVVVSGNACLTGDLYREYSFDIHDDRFVIGKSVKLMIVAAVFLGVAFLASLRVWKDEKKQKKQVIARGAKANLSASGKSVPMMEGVQQL